MINWNQAVAASRHWRGVIALADDTEEGDAGDPLSIVRHGQALTGVAETLARWRLARA